MNTECNISIDKCRKLLSDLTGGQLNILKGMINGLATEFAKRSEEELSKACSEFLFVLVMHADNTVGRVNGENVFIHVCVLPDGRALYFFNRKKEHEGAGNKQRSRAASEKLQTKTGAGRILSEQRERRSHL